MSVAASRPPQLDRSAFRAYKLDGAMLFFQPSSGTHVRVTSRATHGLRREAPRVAMFGITNACNLACSFCSRDVGRPSRWTVATAAAALRGLAEAGTLEVAYGGGEPFTFRGFAELVAELDATTSLAQHVTTNGTGIDRARWSAFARRFGIVRLSIYDHVDWRPAAGVLAQAGQRWGANVLCDAARLPQLAALLAELAERGAHDVSLLSYVGPDRALHLDAQGDRALAAIIADSPLPCRISVCLGDRLGVDRLEGRDTAGDCGAGRDFVSITPDRRVQACSFQDRSTEAPTAEAILAAWRGDRALAQASPRRGCARALPQLAPPAPPPLAVWQGFSGNNSGECLLVARFADVAAAEAHLAELLPGWSAEGGPYPAPWRKLLADEGLALAEWERHDDDALPRELIRIGATMLASHYAPDDAFPELRGLAWKRGAIVTPGGIHVHDDATAIVAVRARDAADRAALLDMPPAFSHWWAVAHGEQVLARVPLFAPHEGFIGLDLLRDGLNEWVGSRAHAIEVVFMPVEGADIVAAGQPSADRPAERPRLALWLRGDGDVRLEAAVAALGGRSERFDHLLLVDPAVDRNRLALVGYQHRAYVESFDGEWLRVSAWLGGSEHPEQRVDELDAWVASEPAFAGQGRLRRPDPAKDWDTVTVEVDTPRPAEVLRAIRAHARAVGVTLNPTLAEVDPVGRAVRRVLAGC